MARTGDDRSVNVLEQFSPATRAWFEGAFPEPTPAQSGAWEAIAEGRNALVIAPTGSGKTLAGFLWSIDRLAARPEVDDKERLRVVYISPLKALAADIERNLRTPLSGVRAAAGRLGLEASDIRVSVRTGDTPQEERRKFASAPPDILITTPESLFLILTSQARAALRYVDTVIVDEVHALAGNKRGAHLAVSLERLDHLCGRPLQRLGLSATVRPPDEVARFLGGVHPVTVVNPVATKTFDLSIVVPMEDMTEPGEITGDVTSIRGKREFEVESLEAVARASAWPHIEASILELIRKHSSTIVFVNSRRLAERLCNHLNEIAGDEVARAHHGSVSKERRRLIEEDLKAGRLPAVVATSSLELGIDMADVELVVQVEAPGSVASGLQRIGRAGHQVGAVSRGVMFPKYRGDLLECAVVSERMRAGLIEASLYPRNPLDVLAQQIVAMVAMDDWEASDLEAVIARAAPFHDLPASAFEATLDMLSGRYPSHQFAELRPRLNWDRATGVLTARSNAQSLAVTSGGTIPDRGLFGVFLAGRERARVGELDEEMVYETRVGDVFVLGASSWIIEEITHDRVLVTPAPGRSGVMPFWHGDAPGRPVELGRAVGAFIREISALGPAARSHRLEEMNLDAFAARNLSDYLDEQEAATGVLPDDTTVLVERFKDELGDWRVCIHSPFGARVHAPWSLAIEAQAKEHMGVDVQCIYTDDGIVVRLPEANDAPDASFATFDPEDVEHLVVEQVGSSALFASRFRECASRALLLPRRRPGSRSPLWQQRQKSARLLQVASEHETFPIVLETFRECLQDVFDLPALVELMASIRRREVKVVEVDTALPSPFASSLQFGYVSAFMYEGDTPLAERRAQALSLDRSLLAEIMGREELRDLIDAPSLTDLEIELQRLTDARKGASADEVHDLLRALGDLSPGEIRARVRLPTSVDAWLVDLVGSRQILETRVAGELRFIAIEDAALYRDALGAPLPVGVPDAFLQPAPDPFGDLVGRYAATHGPFLPGDLALRLGVGVAIIEVALGRLEVAGKVIAGEYRPGGTGREYIDADVLRRVRRRSLAAWRKEIEPAPPDALARFTLAWHGIGASASARSNLDALYRVIEQLQGAPVPASVLESQILPARLSAYSPSLLDQLGASGELVWAGAGALGGKDGWIVLALADKAPLLLPEPQPVELSDLARSIHELLARSGALFFRQIAQLVDSLDDAELVDALWELVWSGHVTNDTLAAVRAFTRAGSGGRRSRGGRRGPALPARAGPPSSSGRWSLVADRSTDSTLRMHAGAQQLLSRHGLLVRSALAAERAPGGFSGVYPVLKAMEEAGKCRRGYFVDGLGGAQFALPGAVDRMRALVDSRREETGTVVISATDPANPYGAALPWPDRAGAHRAGRKAGALVVLIEGALILYVERGGRSVLSFSEDRALLQPAADALALAARDGALGRLAVERADGESVLDTPFAQVLVDSGFRMTSRGLRLRA